MNNVTLVGRLTQDPEIKELNDGTFRTIINVAVSRDYRNSEGVYDADFIKCVLWNGIASATKDYCRKGDVVGIKGKLQSRNYETDNKEKKYVLEVIAEKVTFLSSKKADE
ncbi:MAG: single-stranded DNA-binding protein [Firmicutes bacterium]|nr:single-stranded DNA-binding protein [Bacillota bacterium]